MSKGTKGRTAARRVVEQQKAREKRRAVTLWTSVAVVAVLVIAGMTGWGVLARQEKDRVGKLTTPAAAVDQGTAFAVGTGPVTVDIYEDFMCPACREFETASGATLKQLATEGKVTIRYHPIAILDDASNGTRFSTRAAAAAAAAAEGDRFTEYHDVLFANQPAEGSDGLDNAELIRLGTSVGLTGAAFGEAVTDGTYDAWATTVTDTAASRGYVSTPTVLVGGKKITSPTPAALTAAVTAAAG